MSDQQENNERPGVHYEGGLPVFDSRLSEVERKQTEAEGRDQRYKDAQIALNRRLVNATVALVAATIIMGVIGGIQVWYIHRQWKLTSDGLSKMGDQIWAAKDAAYASKKASDTAAQTLPQMQAQTGAQAKAAGAAKRAADSAEASRIASAAQFRQQVSPYIIAQTTRMNQRPMAGVILGVESVIKNTGMTPALNFRVSHTFKFENRLPCAFVEASFTSDSSRGNIGPGMTRAVRVFGERGLLESEVSDIENGRVFVCYSATFEYEDIFGETHRAEVFSYYKPPKPGAAVGEGDLFLYGFPSHNGFSIK